MHDEPRKSSLSAPLRYAASMMFISMSKLSRMNSARIRVVGEDAPDLGSREENVRRLLGSEEALDGVLAAQVELCVRWEQERSVSVGLKPPHDRGPHEAAMTGDEDARVSVHS